MPAFTAPSKSGSSKILASGWLSISLRLKVSHHWASSPLATLPSTLAPRIELFPSTQNASKTPSRDVLWLSATKVVEVGRALATPDSLWLRAPLLGRDEAMDYAALRRATGVAITFDEMQQMLLADDAEERLNALARRLGLEATLRIKARRRVDRLTFPYPKTIRQQ